MNEFIIFLNLNDVQEGNPFCVELVTFTKLGEGPECGNPVGKILEVRLPEAVEAKAV